MRPEQWPLLGEADRPQAARREGHDRNPRQVISTKHPGEGRTQRQGRPFVPRPPLASSRKQRGSTATSTRRREHSKARRRTVPKARDYLTALGADLDPRATGGGARSDFDPSLRCKSKAGARTGRRKRRGSSMAGLGRSRPTPRGIQAPGGRRGQPKRCGGVNVARSMAARPTISIAERWQGPRKLGSAAMAVAARSARRRASNRLLMPGDLGEGRGRVTSAA